jgi:hypothetical protein
MPSHKKCSVGKVWRKGHKSASGKRIAGACVKKGGKSRSMRKMSAHKCSSGKVWRKRHSRSNSKKLVAGKCVKKGGKKSSKKM